MYLGRWGCVSQHALGQGVCKWVCGQGVCGGVHLPHCAVRILLEYIIFLSFSQYFFSQATYKNFSLPALCGCSCSRVILKVCNCIRFSNISHKSVDLYWKVLEHFIAKGLKTELNYAPSLQLKSSVSDSLLFVDVCKRLF